MKPCKFQRPNKGAAIYVESTSTVRDLLFHVRTLLLNNNSDIFIS